MTEDDIDWINKSMDKSEYRLSRTFKTPDEFGSITGKGDTIEEVEKALKEAASVKSPYLTIANEPRQRPSQTATEDIQTQETQNPPSNQTIYTCNTCGARAFLNSGTSKKGNPYKIMKCSKFPDLESKGGHSKFMEI